MLKRLILERININHSPDNYEAKWFMFINKWRKISEADERTYFKIITDIILEKGHKCNIEEMKKRTDNSYDIFITWISDNGINLGTWLYYDNLKEIKDDWGI
jgi:hypothetical protein